MDKYSEIKKIVYEANMRLPNEGLVKLTWGNVSQISEDRTYFAIKPSGVKYNQLKEDDIVIVSIETGQVLDGVLNPSSDAPSHRFLYKFFEELKGITHTHSLWATTFAQIGINVDPFGTTHADSFQSKIFCTRDLLKEEIESDYELNAAKSILEVYQQNNIDILLNPAVLLKSHGVFTFGTSADSSVDNAVICEFVSNLAYNTSLKTNKIIEKNLFNKHNSRKHGPDAYYGQKSK